MTPVLDRTAPLRRALGQLGQGGTVDAALEAWETAHAHPSTRAAARAAAPALVRALRRRAFQLSAPPEAPALRRRLILLADRVRRESEVPALRAELRLEGLLARLDAGEALETAELHEQLAPVLAVADAFLPGAGVPGAENPLEDLTAAARLLSDALSALLHRTLHNDDVDSPLASGPRAFLAPLRESTAFGLATAPLRADRPAPPAGPARRVLLVHGENHNFVADLTRRIEASGAQLRVLDLTAPPEGLAFPGFQQLVAERLARATGRAGRRPQHGARARVTRRRAARLARPRRRRLGDGGGGVGEPARAGQRPAGGPAAPDRGVLRPGAGRRLQPRRRPGLRRRPRRRAGPARRCRCSRTSACTWCPSSRCSTTTRP